MRKLFLIPLLVLTLTAAIACSGMSIEEFSRDTPRFVPEQVFLNSYEGNGLFYDRSKVLQRMFSIKISGEKISDTEFILREDLRFDDGETIDRDYRFKKIDDENYEVSADALVGVAKVRANGSALRWKYTLKVDVSGDIWELDFEDWMFLRPDGTILNRAYASKWGLHAGEVIMALTPER